MSSSPIPYNTDMHEAIRWLRHRDPPKQDRAWLCSQVNFPNIRTLIELISSRWVSVCITSFYLSLPVILTIDYIFFRNSLTLETQRCKTHFRNVIMFTHPCRNPFSCTHSTVMNRYIQFDSHLSMLTKIPLLLNNGVHHPWAYNTQQSVNSQEPSE